MKISNGVHHNRWFFWTLAAIVGTGLILLLRIQENLKTFDQEASELIANQTASFKTFHSGRIGITVRYPLSWQIEIDPTEEATVSLQNPNDFNENITITKTKITYEPLIRSALVIASERALTIDGFEGTWILGKDPNDPATGNVILIARGGDLYQIAGSADSFERIAKSIRFDKVN